MVLALLLTTFCMLCGFLVVTAHFGAQPQGRLQTLRMDVALRKVLKDVEGIQKGAWLG